MTLQITSEWIPSDLPEIDVRVEIAPTEGGFLRLRCLSRSNGVTHPIANTAYCKSMRGVLQSVMRTLSDHLTTAHRASLVEQLADFAGSDRNWRKGNG